MTARPGKNASIFIGAYDLSGDCNLVTPRLSRQLLDATTFGCTGVKNIYGLNEDSLNIEGLLDNTEFTEFAALRAASTGHQVTILYGTAVGDPGVACREAKLKTHVMAGVVKDINKVSAELLPENYPFEPVLLAHPLTARASDSTGTAINNGSATAAGARGYAHITTYGSGTITLSLRHSTDNFVADDTELMAFTGATAIGSAYASATGAVKQYVKAQWTLGGGSATFVIAFIRL